MPILSHIERRAMEEGREQGRREIVLEVLNERFNEVPNELIDRINQTSDTATLKILVKRLISIESIAELEEVLASIMPDN